MGTIVHTFSDGSLDTVNFGTSVNNNGTVTESLANSRLEIIAPAVSADAAVAIYKGVNPVRSNDWAARWKFDVSSLTLNQQMHCSLCTRSGIPVVGNAATINATHALFAYFTNLNGAYSGYFAYRNTSGTFYYWNRVTGLWQTSFTTETRITTLSLNTIYYWLFSCDGLNFSMELQDENEGSQLGPATIATGSVNFNTEDWLTIGNLYKDFYFGQINPYEFRYTGPEISSGIVPKTHHYKQMVN